MSEFKVYILWRYAQQSRLYQSWLPQLTRPYEIVEEFPGSWEPPDDCGIVITHEHYRWEHISGLRKILSIGQIPILILADGIFEYRNIFEHPDLPAGSIFQPLLGHKLACLGRGQARVVESWGNLGKCEVVGFPRLDPLLQRTLVPPAASGPFRLLVCSANKPAFTEQQRTTVIQSLICLRDFVANTPEIQGRPLRVNWRLTDGLDEALELPPPLPRDERPALWQVLDESDAVITTPSTIFLESALLQRPTAILDFHNVPQFVPAAWTISAASHILQVVSELASPPAAKMLFQNHVLHDQLECQDPATPRLLFLIEQMIAARQTALASGQPLHLPERIVTDPRRGFAAVETGFRLQDLYPDNPVLRDTELERVQLELNALKARLADIPDQLFRALQNLEDRNQRIDELQAKYEDTKNRLNAAKERLKKWRTGVFRLDRPPPESDATKDAGDDV